MPEYLEKPTKMDKIVPIVCIGVLLAFFAMLPFMIRDENRIKAERWREQGCRMYDENVVSHLPAKCNNDFTDHYKPQTPRTQP